MLFSRLWYYISSIPTLLFGIRNWAHVIGNFLHPSNRSFIVQLQNGARFFVRTPMDVWVLKEACLDHEYERASIAIQDSWTIIDVGAGTGDFAIGVAREHPRCRIMAFEPFEESFSLLQKNLEMNRVGNVQTFSTAITGHAGAAVLRAVSAEPVQFTTVRGNASVSSSQVNTTTLAQVFSQLQLVSCDYIKMDCEGAEYEILLNSDQDTLRKIKHLCLEYHDGVVAQSHHELQDFLARQGFEVRVSPSRVHRNLGLMYARQTNLGRAQSN